MSATKLPETEADVITALREIKDPEVPVVDIVELGIVRGASIDGSKVRIQVTPTYSGCPAMQVIEDEIIARLEGLGFREVAVNRVFSPPWTTDWIEPAAKEKLRAYGIAPPGPAPAVSLVQLVGPEPVVNCPYCGSPNTIRQSEFGSTSCKAIYSCLACHQPFEHFKAI